MSECSFAIVDAALVEKACESYLESRQRRIAVLVNKMVEDEMSRRFFKAKTREHAIARRQNAIDMLNWRGKYWASRVEDILALAKLSSDRTVRLTSDDVNLLCDFL